jgi:polysaccharide deacetylase family protein (PEP-CTERM system associated)
VTRPAGRVATQPIVNALAVDLEDYFQVSAFDRVVGFERWPTMRDRLRANTDRLLGLFDDAGVKATFFVLGWNAERQPDLIARIAAAGHEVASHSHAHRLVYEMTPDEFREDLRRARGAIEDATGVRVNGFRAPSYSITNASLWAIDILAEEEYVFDSSIFPIRHDRYGIPGAERHPYPMHRNGATIWEIPPATVRFLGMTLPAAAGGYLRLLPFWWSSRAVRQVNHLERQPVVVSTHPWELDPDQPRLDVGRLTRLRHYSNLDRTEPRLRQLLADFRFTTMSGVIADRLLHPAPQREGRLAG